MADRGRDLKISILSDAERFDLAHPADELEKVADAAADTGTALGRMGDDLDTLAKDAETTAAKVDSSFDAIARSSKAKMGKGMDDGAKSAKGSLKDVGDEAASTARETGASFDGTTKSVVDSFQEIAANALSALGPVGAGIGLAAAFGMGILRAQAEKTKEAVSGLVGSIIDQDGKLERSNVLDKLKEFAQDGSLTDLRRQAEDAKVPIDDFLLSMAGDPAAMERTTAAVDAAMASMTKTEILDESGEQATAAYQAMSNLRGELGSVADNYRIAGDAVRVYKDATGEADEAQGAFTDALGGFSDTLGAYTDTLAIKEEAEKATATKTADATKDQKDSWEDYAKAVKVSVAEYLATLAEQVTAQETWEANMTRLAGKVSTDTLAELARMGPEGAPLVANLATASDKELAKLDALLSRRAKSGVDAFAAGIDAKADEVAAAAGRARDRAVTELSKPIVATLKLDTSLFYRELREAEKHGPYVDRYRP